MHPIGWHAPRFETANGRPDQPIVAVGHEAPDFTLRNADGEPCTLTRLRGGWVVLYFYPEDHTLGCTIEARRFRAYFESISLQQAAIVGVSRDNAGNHCSFRDRHALPFELLSDEDNVVHDLYGAWRRPLLRRDAVEARRCTFLIDPDGIVCKVYAKVNPMSHAAQVVHDLRELGQSMKRQLTA